MVEPDATRIQTPTRGIRWWPGVVLVVAAVVWIVWARLQEDWPFQTRNLATYRILLGSGVLLLVWWTFLSRAPTRLRLSVTFGVAIAIGVCLSLVRLRGLSGDMGLVLEFRWAKHERPAAAPALAPTNSSATIQRPDSSVAADFPQFRGPNRDGILAGPALDMNWAANPPQIVWRKKAGAAWSGFAIVGGVCLTQEQRGDDECVVACEVASGREVWLHTDKARYNTTLGGEGPRATPTVGSNRVFTVGATGILNCLDLATGRRIWMRDLIAEAGGKIPDWGFAASPLLVDGLVIVHSGDQTQQSLLAFRAEDGERVWAAGNMSPGYSSPAFATLAGVRQVLAFNDGNIAAHDPGTGKLLWTRPWGNGNVVCSSPVVVSENRVLFSSGYGVGAELLEITNATKGRLAANLVWKSNRMKSKFAHVFVRAGFLYGLDDGVLACVDLADGSQRWKEGRYGHGQGLLVGELYLLMAESGELVLLRPTPDAPDEIARFRVFKSKTWNPIALSGDLLLVRNDQEAACLRLKLTR